MPITEGPYHQNKQTLKQEHALIKSAQKDSTAFAPLYNKYHEQIFRYVYQRVDTVDQAKDIVSAVFLKAIQNINGYEYRGVPFSSWLYRIAYSELNQSYREGKTRRTVNLSDDILDSPDIFDVESDNSEHLRLLGEAMSCLAQEDLEFVEFRYFEKRSVKEISEIMSISASNVKVKTHRALKKLKNVFYAKLNAHENA